MTVAKYYNIVNCQSSTCDYNGLLGNVRVACGCYPAVTYTLTYYCGYDSLGYLCQYSDSRLKSGAETIKDALSKIMQIEAVEYDWNENLNKYDYFKRKGRLHTIGLIAQDVRKYYPEVVNMGDDGYYSVEYNKLNAVLVEAIKSQQIFIEEIKDELKLLETIIN